MHADILTSILIDSTPLRIEILLSESDLEQRVGINNKPGKALSALSTVAPQWWIVSQSLAFHLKTFENGI